VLALGFALSGIPSLDGSHNIALAASQVAMSNLQISPDQEPEQKLKMSSVDDECADEFDKVCANEHMNKLEHEYKAQLQKHDDKLPKQKQAQNTAQSDTNSQIYQADQAVNAVQVYLNKTYGGISSYDRVVENGVTGWRTIYSLIEGLQYELGIDNLVQNFGPTTQQLYTQKIGKLTASFSGINGAVGNMRGSAKRIFYLIQGALLAKGFSPGKNDMSEPNPTSLFSGVSEMTSNAGFLGMNYVDLKVAKGLFSMDAYRLISGGDENIRAIERDLNSRYALKHAAFDIIPTDGYYSRNVSIGYIYALQFELGFSDDQATGFVGEGTKSRLKTQAVFDVGQVDTAAKYFVHLFKAGMTFNEFPILYDGAFMVLDTTKVKKLQAFYELDKTGRADYPTWMALLVSNGDSSRRATACDVSIKLDQYKINKLKELGCETVGRYLSNTENATPVINKETDKDELNRVFASGMSVFPIMQEWNHREKDMTYENGLYQGKKASQKAKALGFQTGTVVYFAVDLDLMGDQIIELAVPFFQGVNEGIASGRNDNGIYIVPGIYSARNTCNIIASYGLANSCFISDMSTGFSGNLGFSLPQLWAYDQIQEVTIDAGFSTEFQVDRNVKRTGAPAYSFASNDPNIDTWLYLQDLQNEADKGLFTTKRDANIDVGTYIRCIWYDDASWYALSDGQLCSTSYKSKVDDMKSKGLIHTPRFKRKTKHNDTNNSDAIVDVPVLTDPVSKIELDLPHLFAAMNGYIKSTQICSVSDYPCVDDLVGWAGDLTTLAIDAVNPEEKDKKLTIRDFTDKYFGGKEYTFPAEDLIQDFDAIGIAGLSIPKPFGGQMRLSDAVINYYSGVTDSYRWNNAIETRFRSSENVSITFDKALTGTGVLDPIYLGIASKPKNHFSEDIGKTTPSNDQMRAVADAASKKLIKIANGEVSAY
jgi:peptidoglycan hydrolase-like protein with peptidoglycan-binding domain